MKDSFTLVTSDVHIGLNISKWKYLLNAIECYSDLSKIVLLGDIVHTIKDIKLAKEFLFRLLNLGIPIYYIFGNLNTVYGI